MTRSWLSESGQEAFRRDTRAAAVKGGWRLAKLNAVKTDADAVKTPKDGFNGRKSKDAVKNADAVKLNAIKTDGPCHGGPVTVTGQPSRHSSRSRTGRSTDIRTECPAVYTTLRRTFMACIASRINLSYSMDSAPDRHSAAAERLNSSSVLVVTKVS